MVEAIVSALLNVVLLAGIPFLIYYAYHRWRHQRSFAEVARRAGLQRGELRYVGYSAALAAVVVAVLIIQPPPLEASVREGSAFQAFEGLGLTTPAVVMALFYGVLATGFSEEFLFRGLLTGSLSRRLPLRWANLVQALLFLAPHLVILFFAPEVWGILPLIFVGALLVGWVRVKSGSILGPWLVHAAVNVTMGLSIAARTAS